MKRGNDGEKIMGPMFPRLHVNDTEKGGPRAPPRNKMALYEQLSIPSQRFSHAVLPCNLNNNTATSVHPSSQVRPSEKQCSQHSELSTSLVQVKQRKKMDEDDYRVPIFIQPVPAEFDKYSNGINQEKDSSSNPPYFHPALKFQKANETGMFQRSIGQEVGSKKGENSNESVAGQKQAVSSISHEPGVNLTNSVDRLRTDNCGQPEHCGESRFSSDSQSTAAMGPNMVAVANINSSDSEEALPLEDQNIVHDLSYDTGSGEDESCRSLHTENLERDDNVSETSILDTESALDISPDDAAGILGQKQFWKARRAIMNQQRVFAVQVFELHRLIKVQRLIAASPHLLLEEDSNFFDKPRKPLSGKKRPLDYAANATSNASKEKGDSENPIHKKERSAENTVEKSPLSPAQNGVPPSNCRPSAGSVPAPYFISSDHNNARASCFNYPQGHQWLIPVMSASEGLVYKPFPAPGSVGQGCGPSGPNPMMGNFLAPMYGLPAPSSQYPFPSFPPYGPHGYFPPYGMPIMSSAAFSGSSIDLMNPQPVPGQFSAREAMSTTPTQNNGAVPDGLMNQRGAEEMEVQGSSASSPSERQQDRRASNTVEGRNMLALFHRSSPAVDASTSGTRAPVPDRAPQVIKVVPRNGVSASESAARIFRSIQEERKQYD
ncbi:hypothetical protein C2S53_003011 [Perilla frutescens var. hirtella]|uniref:Uncharacterized protein n=1 Tax=Perilla frutescens var. hirtella TaxID=608512 RepID=A0AAD4JL19_PERFH|nr:hypothetical protein C2S53_003011 [Perilla frutescens var. hirtella]